uniref:Uncharacterized protein n=1 Tax=Paracidobacterium acidisoli TaxID=2303751 RepID=A0A372ITC1_9BACT
MGHLFRLYSSAAQAAYAELVHRVSFGMPRLPGRIHRPDHPHSKDEAIASPMRNRKQSCFVLHRRRTNPRIWCSGSSLLRSDRTLLHATSQQELRFAVFPAVHMLRRPVQAVLPEQQAAEIVLKTEKDDGRQI